MELVREKIWDPVTRLWHWGLAIVVVTGWSLGEFMSFATVRWHFYCGYAVLGLLAFRLLWGLVGPRRARFGALLFSPRATLDYLGHLPRREPSGLRGHNPLGALSVIAMLVLLLAQAGSGLFIEADDYFESAPLAHLVSEAVTNRLTWWHKLLSKVLLAVVALHVAAVLYYLLWKRENLVLPMITGWKQVRAETADDR